jgi:hypothetical protein
VALRSFPRRYNAALARPDDEDRPDDVLHRRPKGGGLSAIEHAAWAATAIAEVGEALAAVMYHDDPAVSLPVLDPSPEVVVAGAGGQPDAAVSALREAAVGLAGAIELAPNDGWSRTGHAGSERVTALDVARHAVHLGVHHLRLAEQAVTEAAHDLG